MDMESLETKGGDITKEYRLECATCVFWDLYEVESTKAVEKLARKQGWSETDQFGWICPDCKKKDREKLTFWKSTLDVNVLGIDLKCFCGVHGEGEVVIRKDLFDMESVSIKMPGGWGFFVPEPKRTLVPLCPKCKGTKGDVGYPPQTKVVRDDSSVGRAGD